MVGVIRTRDLAKGKRSRDGKLLLHYQGEYTLLVQINSAQGIDDIFTHPELGFTDCYYRVGLWVDSENVYQTTYVRALTCPEWKQLFHVPVDPNSAGFTGRLSLVVERFSDQIPAAAGTSRNTAVVGRTRVWLPDELGKRTSGRFQLARVQGGACRPEGSLNLNMELRRYYYY